jgi:serine/threonine protein kinase
MLGNIIITADGKIKLIDFGLAYKKKHRFLLTKSECGTFLYMAPEILGGLQYNEKVDMWALGILVFGMLTGGKHPIWKSDKFSRAGYVEKLRYDWEPLKYLESKCNTFSESAISFLVKLLDV